MNKDDDKTPRNCDYRGFDPGFCVRETTGHCEGRQPCAAVREWLGRLPEPRRQALRIVGGGQS